jgi:alcohol dehydrogenase class IV
MPFEFATSNRIIFGSGAVGQVPALAKELGRSPLIVTGKNTQRAERLGISSTLFSIEGEPEIETVRRGVAVAKKAGCDMVIGFGGGSALDSAKAIAAMMTNNGDVLDYLEIIGSGKPLRCSPAPVIAIPTTAGTGSEVTRNSVLGSPEHKLKVSLRSPLMLPKIALIDPELTFDLPPAITARTGLDALTQLIEPYVCSRANPMTDSLCREGMIRAARSLRPAFSDGRNAAARGDMSVASLFGGLALANAGLGAVHGLAGVIGGMFGAAHGAVCAILLPRVMTMNIRALLSRDVKNPALTRYEEVARLLTGRPDAQAEDGVEWVARLVSELKIPRLGSFGLTSHHVADIVEKSKNASSMKANPVVLTNEELAAVVESAI